MIKKLRKKKNISKHINTALRKEANHDVIGTDDFIQTYESLHASSGQLSTDKRSAD